MEGEEEEKKGRECVSQEERESERASEREREGRTGSSIDGEYSTPTLRLAMQPALAGG